MEENKRINIVLKGITKPVTTVIPEQVVTEEVEVDTLQEFLKEVDLNEEQLRIAVKAYKDEKITQPSYNMEDVLRKVDSGRKKAEQILKNETTSKLELTDSFVVDALVASNKWKCVTKLSNPKRYIVERI